MQENTATKNDVIYLTPQEVSDKYRISKGTLLNMRRRGTGPEFIYLGQRKVVYTPEKIQEWLDSNSRSTLKLHNQSEQVLDNRLLSIAKDYCQSGKAERFANQTQKIINKLT